MKLNISCLVLAILVSGSNFAVAQDMLRFDQEGKNTNSFLRPLYKYIPSSTVDILVMDSKSTQPKSRFQKLIDTNPPLISLGSIANSADNGTNFPYKANTKSLIYSAAIPIGHQGKIPWDKPGEFMVKITKQNIDNVILKKHFETKAVRESYQDFVRYLPAYDSLKAIYDPYAVQIDKLALQDRLLRSTANTIELGLYLDSIGDTQYQLVELVQLVKKKNADWMANWKWLTEGKEMLNPFYPNVSFLGRKVDDELLVQQEVLDLLKNKISQFSVSESIEYLTVRKIIEDLIYNIQLLKKEKVRLETLKAESIGWLATYGTPDVVLNTFKLYSTDLGVKEPIFWMQHKDAASNYASLNEKSIPNTVFEDDKMMVYVHNLKPDQKVKASEKVDSIALATTTEKALDDPFAALSKARGSSASILSLLAGMKGFGLSLVGSSQQNKSNTQQFDRSVRESASGNFLLINTLTMDRPSYDDKLHQHLYGSEKTFLVSQRALFTELRRQVIRKITIKEDYSSKLLLSLNPADSTLNAILIKLDKSLDTIELRLVQVLDVNTTYYTYQKYKELVQWLSLQTPPPFEEIEKAFAKPSAQSAFRSENVLTGESRSAKGNNRISYSLTEDGKSVIVAKDEYTTYKTVRFWPTVGVNYVFGPRTAAVFSTSASAFDTNTDIDNFEAVVGVKIYLHEKNITTSAATRRIIREAEKSNQLRGNNFLSSTFIHVGLGVSHNFLKNYFVGAGFDLFPGISIQGGGNLFFRKGYDLQNGQIKTSVDIGHVTGYVGIYLDPTLVTRLIQLF